MPGPGTGPQPYQGRHDIMKKQTKKLTLAKETVRSLNDLTTVRGGSQFSGVSCDYPCENDFRPITGFTCDC